MAETQTAAAGTTTTIRIPAHIYAKVGKLAEINRRSINSQMVAMIENDIQRSRLAGAKGK